MNDEIRFKTNDYKYYNRAAGIVMKDDKFLFMKMDFAKHYIIPGGHLELGEDSKTGLAREIKEELGYTVDTEKLFCIQENIFEDSGINHHGVEYYYLITVKEDIDCTDKHIVEIDRGKEISYEIKWFTIDELKDIDLKPYTVKELLVNKKFDSLVHLIKKD